MASILEDGAPDLNLYGRDEDTVVLSRLKSSQPRLPGVLTCANPEASFIVYDKWQTYLFARRHALPVADSFVLGESGGEVELLAFAERVGYPLIAKPSSGFASQGVFFVRGPHDIVLFPEGDGTVFQEYLGNHADVLADCEDLSGPPRLFTQLKDAGQHSCHTVISPSAQIAPMLKTHNQHEYGQS